MANETTIFFPSSSAIGSVELVNGIVRVEFTNGRIYDYPGLDEGDFAVLLEAHTEGDSVGKAWNANYRKTDAVRVA